MKVEYLGELGLNKSEINVYLALLKLGSANVNEISKESGVYRRTVYDALKFLIDKGIVGTIIKDKKQFFSACEPSDLLSILKEKEEKIRSLIPEMENLRKGQKEELNVEVYSGQVALRKLIEEQIESGEFLGIGMTKKAWEILEFSMPHIVKKAIKHKTKVKLLVYEQARDIYEKLKIKHLQVRYLNKEYCNPSTILIWKDKISISYYGTNPVIIVIKNKQINESYKNYFKMLWEKSE